MATRYDTAQEELKRTPRTWLVTGVGGFIGSHLLEQLLLMGQHVVGLDNFATGYQHNLDDVKRRVGPAAWSRFRFIEGDITSVSDCRDACKDTDYVLHQAALGSVPRSIDDPLASHTANVTGFVNMLVAARDAQVERFVYASSSSVYGDHPGLPKVESETGRVLSPYAATKSTNEIYGDAFSACYDLPLIGLRYFNVFGPRQDPNGAYAAVIPKWIGQLLQRDRCQIYGDGETSRDFTYVGNAVQANLLAAITQQEPDHRVYNVACGQQSTLNELFQAIRLALQDLQADISDESPDHTDFRPGDVRHSHADIGLAVRELGYTPSTLMEAGLKETTRWYLSQQDTSQ